MLKFAIPLLLVALLQLVISLGILLESRRSNALAQRIFAGLTATTLLWTLINIIVLYADTRGNASNIYFFNVANKFGFALGILSLLLIYVFNLVYPITKKNSLLQKSLSSLGVLLIVLTPFNFISGKFVINDVVTYSGGAFSSVIAIFGLMVIIAFYLDNTRMLRSKRTPLLRAQAITMLTGLSLSILHAVIFIILLPLLGRNEIAIYAIGYFAPFFFTGFTIFSLLRQSLFDVRLIIARSVAYLLVLATIGISYSLIIFGISSRFLGTETLGFIQQVVLIIVAIFLGVTFQPLKKFFDKFTNRIFYRDAYDTRNLLDTLNKVLVSNIELEKLLIKSAGVIQENLKPEFCLFEVEKVNQTSDRIIGVDKHKLKAEDLAKVRSQLIDSGLDVVVTDRLPSSNEQLKAELNKQNIAIWARLASRHDEHSVGHLILGPKKSGNVYNKDDIEIIDIIANELVIAIQNALRFEEIQQFNITLQHKIDDATKELRRANDKLKALDEVKDEFISMASHQLRTPLTSVKGYVSMVLEGDAGKLSAMQKKLLDEAFVSSQRMVYLIADLLNVSRLRTGKFVIESKPTQLADLVEGEISQLGGTLKAKNLTLTYDKPKNFPLLMLDETKIRQVVMNFADNAMHYTPANGHITIQLLDKPEVVEFTVTDDGIGVPAEEQHHLFTKFYRAGNAKRARPDGTGLGLFMAKKVIAAQGGAIIFKSSEGKGSTFGFTFAKSKLKPVPADAEHSTTSNLL